MITLITSDNIFNNTKVVLDYLESDKIFKESATMRNVSWIRLEIAGEDNEEIFEDFYEEFLTSLQRDFGIYFYYSESFKELKSRIRSYVKLFYQLKKEGVIPAQNLIEKEIELGNNESILTGIIRINEVDPDYLFDELTGNGFKFGLAIDETKNESRPEDLENLEKKLTKEIFNIGKSVRINYLNVINQILTPNSFIYSYLYDGKDDLIFTIYLGGNIYLPLKDKIKNILPKEEILKERQASSREVDRLIDLYFRDWRTPYTQGP